MPADSSLWDERAQALAEQAVSLLKGRGTVDEVLSSLEAAALSVRISIGEVPGTELDGYPFPGEEQDVGDCICPPDLLARGGFKGGCPVHG